MADLHSRQIQRKQLDEFAKTKTIQVGYYGNRSIDLSRVVANFVDLESQDEGAFHDRYPRLSEDLTINVVDRNPSGAGQYDRHIKNAPGGYYEI